MRSTIVRSRGLKPRLWTILLLPIMLMGSSLRISHLPDKPVWFDESFTRLRISGRDEHDDAEGSFGVLARLNHQLRGHGSFMLTR